MLKILTVLTATSLLLANPAAHARDWLFTNQACHPKITPQCALYLYANHALDKGLVPYATVIEYFQQMSNGLIVGNPDTVVLQNSKYENLADQNREHLVFNFDTHKMTFSPGEDLSPETMDRLFSFDPSIFMDRMGAPNFMAAKKKYYLQTKFDGWKLSFDRTIMIPTDWRSLIHPPLFSLAEMGQPVPQIKPSMNRNPASAPDSPFWSKDYHAAIDSETSTELTQGNQLRLMVNDASYSEKIKLVQEAKKYIFVAVMSFAYTDESQLLINALIDQAHAGLDVRVIMEKVWADIAFHKTVKKLRKGGVKVALANDLLRTGSKQGLFHSKFFVIDGERGVVGGQNLVDRSEKSTGYNHFNKDTDLRVEGPMITDMLDNYGKLWERFTKETFPTVYKDEVVAKKAQQHTDKLRGTENYDNWLANQSPGLCRFISQGPIDDKYKISKAYLETFSRARQSVLMTTQIVNFQRHPIFKTNWATKIYRELFDKANGGVPITLITNGIDGGFLKTESKTDAPIEKFFTAELNDITGYLNTLLRRSKIVTIAKVPNFDVWEHFQYIHSKVAIVDQIVSAIGSYNFETYSAEHSYETAAFCQDQDLTQTLQDDLDLTIANSTPVTIGN